jgi:rSAM/selenodomain-associated transferase 2
MITVIIPTYNEEKHIKATIRHLRLCDKLNFVEEVIVADGGSTDETVAIANSEGAKAVVCPHKGRSTQMNHGASLATGSILYFLHADTLTPPGFSGDIIEKIARGYDAGCFLLSFDYNHWFLKANCWFTRFDVDAFRYGDQSLFVKRNVFDQVNGFCEKHIVFEDYDIIKKIKRHGVFAIVRKPVITSSRKYIDNGIFKLQGIFYLMYFMYRLNFSQQQLLSVFRKLIRQDKL